MTCILADGEQVGKVPLTVTEEIIFKYHFPGVSELTESVQVGDNSGRPVLEAVRARVSHRPLDRKETPSTQSVLSRHSRNHPAHSQ